MELGQGWEWESWYQYILMLGRQFQRAAKVKNHWVKLCGRRQVLEISSWLPVDSCGEELQSMPSERFDLYIGHVGILSEFLVLFAGAVTHGQQKHVRERLRVLCLFMFLTQQWESPYCPNPQVLAFFLVVCHGLLLPELSQGHPASPSSLPVPLGTCSGLLSSIQSTRLLSHWLCVRTCYSSQSIRIYVDPGIVSYFPQETPVF